MEKIIIIKESEMEIINKNLAIALNISYQLDSSKKVETLRKSIEKIIDVLK